MRLGRLTTAFMVSVTAILVGAQAPAFAGKPAAPPSGSSAYVRVNQLGYPVDAASKRAFLLASGVETGATFAVKSGATTVYSAPSAPISAPGARRWATSMRWTSRR